MRSVNGTACWRGHSKCDKCEMRHLVLFSDLEVEDILKNPYPIDDLHFGDGDGLYVEGDDGYAVFTIRAGLVKLSQNLPNGTTRIVRLLRPGHVASLEVLLGGPYAHTATALEPTLTCRIPCETVHRLNRETPRPHKQLLHRFNESVAHAYTWLTHLSTGNARARVVRLFLYLQPDPVEPVCQLFSRDDVAAMLGITAETTSRVIADLRRSGTIRQVRPNRFLCDLDELTEIAAN